MIVDLFAGPGGWSEGLRMLGHAEVGIEWDDAACATARAAGHERVQADVAELDPHAFMREHFPPASEPGLRAGTNANDVTRPASTPAPTLRFGARSNDVSWVGFEPAQLDGLIASPPCQAWSMAGKGGGRRDVEHVIACSMEIAAGNDTRAEHAARCEDPRSILVVEALRWAVTLRPRWIALEQVPPVLHLWSLYAQLLEALGYSCWTGVLEAERYGVPQTRERAVLMARRDRPVQPPAPTHQRYVPGQPQRHDVTLLGEVLPWVSMAEALGWATDLEVHGERGAGMRERHGERKPRLGSEPAPTVTGGGRALGPRWELRANAQANASVRPVDEPAPTITGGHDSGDRVWEPTHYDQRQTGARPRPVEEPAPTMLAEGLAKGVPVWAEKRPATTIAGDPRVSQPGRHDPNESGSQQKNAVRVTVQQAAILQSFRPDYPWQGSRTKQFEQVGNAVPPLLAKAILGELVEPALEGRLAA